MARSHSGVSVQGSGVCVEEAGVGGQCGDRGDRVRGRQLQPQPRRTMPVGAIRGDVPPRGRRSCGRTLALAGLLLALIAGPGAGRAWAQQAEVSGFIEDPSGAAVTHAIIAIQNLATNVRQEATTNAAGVYTLPGLAPGTYTLSVEAAGFERQVIEGLLLNVAGKVTRNITLKVGTLDETVTVSGRGLNINTRDASVSTVVDRQFVENIPMSGRTFQSLLTMVPGAAIVPRPTYGNDAGSFSVNGQRAESNYFTVDGVSANTGTTPYRAVGAGVGFSGSNMGSSALGTTQSLVSLDALQEFRAITSTYSAEYGRTPGGQFAFTTRSGTNQFHGSLFNYYRQSDMDANNWFNNANRLAKPEMDQNNFGGTVGGPLDLGQLYRGRDRTFFFLSYEGLRLTTPTTVVNRTVPSLFMRRDAPEALRPWLNSYPLPNGEDLGNGVSFYTGTFSNPSSLDSTSLRMDHSLNDRFKLFGRYSHAPSETMSRGGILTQRTSTLSKARTLTVGATNIIGARVSNDLRFNYTSNARSLAYEIDNFGGATPWDLNTIPGVGTDGWLWAGFIYGGGDTRSSMTPQTLDQRQINVTNTTSAFVGRHTLKAGIDYRRLEAPLRLPEFQITLYVQGQPEIMNNRMNIQVSRYTGPFNPVFQNFSAFVQDEWKLSPRLTVSLGARWDVNPPPDDAYGRQPYTVDQIDNLATTQLAPQGTRLWKTTWGNIAPRLGVAYRLRESENWDTVLRGGYGIFFDMGNNEAAKGYGGVGLSVSTVFSNAAWPLTRAQLDTVPQPTVTAPYAAGVYGGVEAYDPDLKLPLVHQWNVAAEQMLGRSQSLTLSYVGSVGRRLLLNRTYRPNTLGNANFAPTGALTITRNGATSDYHALQAQFQRRLSHGLQFHVAYTWSHAIDEASSNFAVAQLLRGNSDFDIRHNFQLALTYDIPGQYRNRALGALLEGWAVDSRLSSRSGAPINILGTSGLDPALGLTLDYQPNVVPGQPWYLYDGAYPGGRRINRAAFAAAPAGVQGNLGRNALRGLAATQMDLALRRQFRLYHTIVLELRGEAFNVLNTPNFGTIQTNLNSSPSQFGLATGTLNTQLGGLNSLYQVGGARSIQLAARLRF